MHLANTKPVNFYIAIFNCSDFNDKLTWKHMLLLCSFLTYFLSKKISQLNEKWFSQLSLLCFSTRSQQNDCPIMPCKLNMQCMSWKPTWNVLNLQQCTHTNKELWPIFFLFWGKYKGLSCPTKCNNTYLRVCFRIFWFLKFIFLSLVAKSSKGNINLKVELNLYQGYMFGLKVA